MCVMTSTALCGVQLGAQQEAVLFVEGRLYRDARKTLKSIERWEAGAASPSYTQLESMSDKFKAQFAFQGAM
jgi:hypothetical protein